LDNAGETTRCGLQTPARELSLIFSFSRDQLLERSWLARIEVVTEGSIIEIVFISQLFLEVTRNIIQPNALSFPEDLIDWHILQRGEINPGYDRCVFSFKFGIFNLTVLSLSILATHVNTADIGIHQCANFYQGF
jgi:hypothetical protein